MKNNEKNSTKMNAKDLINVGLFTVLIALATMITSFVGLLPFLMPFIPVFVGLVTGPLFMLYATKIRKPGMFFICELLCGALYAITGHGLWTVLSYSVGGFIGEMFLKKGNYRSINGARLAISFASISCFGQMLPLYIAREAYNEQLIAQYGAEFAETCLKWMPTWSFFPILVLAVVFTFIGCTIGIKMLKKHFVKAGMVKEF